MSAAAGLRPVERASITRRIAALAYELVLLAAVLFVAGFLLLPLMPHAPGQTRLAVLDTGMRTLSFLVLFAVLGGYCAYFWTGGRRTLAMRTWHLWLVDAEGRNLSVARALGRYAAAWIGPALAIVAYAVGAGRHATWLLAVNFAWAGIDPQRQFLHDRIAGTCIVAARR